MPTRGRLIWPVRAVIARLDTAATAEDPDGAGDLDSGYDSVYQEIRAYEDAGQRVTARKETTIRFPVQVEPDMYDQAKALSNGPDQARRISLIAHFKDLEKLGYVNAGTGEPTLQVGDRLAELRHLVTNNLIMTIPDPPGLYLVELTPLSFGLSALQRNLLQLVFESRTQGA